jgi:hypothetical protein
MASITAELTINNAFVAPGACCKYAFSPPVNVCIPSPMPAAGNARDPIKDCVQNHSAIAATVSPIRNPRFRAGTE